jgi:predicted N-formylglutamate amidohydrolase
MTTAGANSDRIMDAMATGQASQIINAAGPTPIVFICEHAARFIPPSFNNLGLAGAALSSHIAWDIGALDVARGMASAFDAPLVASCVSRLLYDCNRPLSASDAVPELSESTVIPGNQSLNLADRQARHAGFYVPFHNDVDSIIASFMASSMQPPVIVTIHSFTPIYRGKQRAVELGILHDTDQRLADALLAAAPQHTNLRVARNQPYGPQDGVTHSLQRHGVALGLLNVMLEIRNDLITSPPQQAAMANMLVGMLTDALNHMGKDAGPSQNEVAHV